MRLPILAAVLVLCGQSAFVHAELKLARLFSDHAVLQGGVEVPIWGWATPGEDITLTCAGQTQAAKAGADGKWTAKLSPLASAGPHTLSVKAPSGSLTVNDILVGQVWLGSGQSNMAMRVSAAQNYEQEQKAANLPQIRMFTVDGKATPAPQQDCNGSWVVCSASTVGNFSATAYFFGKEIHQALDQPVGLINSSVGGTPIDSWLDAEVQRSSPELAPLFQNSAPKPDLVALKASYEQERAAWVEKAKAARKAGTQVPRMPRDPVALAERKGDKGGLFNGKIAPLIPYALRGFLWYQGEANANGSKANLYQYQLPLMVEDWRKRWGNTELPFAWVQLPNYGSRGDGWCLVREGMMKTLRLPHTGMAITLDIGDPKDIHPKNKQAVGKRLAQWALGTVYGQKAAVSGPIYVGHEILGPHVVVKMKHTDGGLVGKNDLGGFVICGEDKNWLPATVRIDDSKLFISNAAVPRPKAVRYAWADTPIVSLWNGAGLPASPFRTDSFPIVVEEVRRAIPRKKAATSLP